jgi:hypothetical protein
MRPTAPDRIVDAVELFSQIDQIGRPNQRR